MIQRLLALVGLLGSVTVTLMSCAGETVAPPKNPASLYWQLTLNQQALNLSTVAPYDTFRLVATPRTLDGTPLEPAALPRFSSDDSTHVLVSSDGLVRALQATTAAVRLLVTLTDGNLTHRNAAFVSVTTDSTPPVLARLSLEPDPPDSAKGSMVPYHHQPSSTIVPRAFDANGNELFGLAVQIESSDSQMVPPPSLGTTSVAVSALGSYPGPVTFYASMVAYGVERSDTLTYTVGLPLFATVAVQTRFPLGGMPPTYRFPSQLTVATGAYIWWLHQLSPPFDVTFDNPTHVAADMVFEQVFGVPLGCGAGAGNIAPFGDASGELDLANICSRHFPVPGAYAYRSEALNAVGAIIVRDEQQAPPLAAVRPGVHRRVPIVWPSRRRNSTSLTFPLGQP